MVPPSPSTEGEWGSSRPLSPLPPGLGTCGAASSSTAHTESVRTTNKISIKLSFVSSLPCLLLWEDVRQGIRSGLLGCWWIIFELLGLAESHKMTWLHMMGKQVSGFDASSPYIIPFSWQQTCD